MNKGISYSDKILVAGASGLAGNSILRSLRKYGYGKEELGGRILHPN